MKVKFKSIDKPSPESLHCKEHILVEGWIYLEEDQDKIESIGTFINGICIQSTSILFARADVTKALSLNECISTGFRMLCGVFDEKAISTRDKNILLEFKVKMQGDSTHYTFAEVPIKLSFIDFNHRHYGNILDPNSSNLMHRVDIYSSGPSSSIASPECARMVMEYLDPSQSVLDVGCGIGAYGRLLVDAGYSWFGIEIKQSDCEELARVGLPHKKVDGNRLPFKDGEFDNAISIEVLEHVENFEGFVSEIARVVKNRALFSVPNIEVIPFYHPLHVVPWHLLEGDHKNFFSRHNLKSLLQRFFRSVEILDYGELPLKTVEGLLVNNHLFAVAEK